MSMWTTSVIVWPAGLGKGLIIRKKFFWQTVVRHWNRVFREAVYVPSEEELKVRLDGVLSNLM